MNGKIGFGFEVKPGLGDEDTAWHQSKVVRRAFEDMAQLDALSITATDDSQVQDIVHLKDLIREKTGPKLDAIDAAISRNRSQMPLLRHFFNRPGGIFKDSSLEDLTFKEASDAKSVESRVFLARPLEGASETTILLFDASDPECDMTAKGLIKGLVQLGFDKEVMDEQIPANSQKSDTGAVSTEVTIAPAKSVLSPQDAVHEDSGPNYRSITVQYDNDGSHRRNARVSIKLAAT